jgi:hypothetical protein
MRDLTKINGKINIIRKYLLDILENLNSLADDFKSESSRLIDDGLREYTNFLNIYEKLRSNLFNSNENINLIQQYAETGTIKISTKINEGLQPLDKSVPHSVKEKFKGTTPYGFSLQGKEYKEIETWKHIIQQFCKCLVDIDPSKMQDAAKMIKYFSNDKRELNKPVEITSSLYVETKLAADYIMQIMRELLKFYNISENEMNVYLSASGKKRKRKK